MQPNDAYVSLLPTIVIVHLLFVDISAYFDNCVKNFLPRGCLRKKHIKINIIFQQNKMYLDIQVLVMQPSVNGTPTKLSLNVLFNKEFA